MKRREMLKLTGAALGMALLSQGEQAWAQKKNSKILFFTRSQGFIHSVVNRTGSELAFAERIFVELGKKHGIEVVCSKDGGLFDGDLEQYDAFAFYTSGDLTQPGGDNQPPMSAAGKTKLLEAIAAGKGFLGIHAATDSFRTPAGQKDPYIAMLGGEFIGHGTQQDVPNLVVSPKFPGLEQLGPAFHFKEEWYTFGKYADDLHVILLQDTTKMNLEAEVDKKLYDRPPYPATWARQHGRGRVFYTSLGHNEAVWTSSEFEQILVGALRWILGQATADLTPNQKQVVPKG